MMHRKVWMITKDIKNWKQLRNMIYNFKVKIERNRSKSDIFKKILKEIICTLENKA
jgi:hypothetical protein